MRGNHRTKNPRVGSFVALFFIAMVISIWYKRAAVHDFFRIFAEARLIFGVPPKQVAR